MSRPHIEFIQQQDVAPNQVVLGSVRDAVSIKPLSVDSDDNSSSNLMEFPAGWNVPKRGHLQVDEELYVLSGDLSISGVRYSEHRYAFLPAGYTRFDCHSEAGAVVLAFFSGRPAWTDGEGACDTRRVVQCLDMFSEPWTGNFHPQFPIGAGRKWLRRDPVTTDETWILGTLPLRHGRRPEKHPVVEEMYLISGELIGPQGVMRPGAYFWRPPEVWHGPFGSKTGCLMLFRTVGGPLSTVYTEDEHDFHWNPPHNPILPTLR